MSITEENVIGKKYRIWDSTNSIWKRLSFWTKASDVECNDGSTVETKIGGIKGITTDLTTTETGYAADMTSLGTLATQINDNLNVRYEPVSNEVQLLIDGVWTYWADGMIEELLIINNSVITSDANKIVTAFTKSINCSVPAYGTNNVNNSFLTSNKTIIGYDVTFSYSIPDSGCPSLRSMSVTFNGDAQHKVTFSGGSGSKTISIGNIETKTLTILIESVDNISVSYTDNVTITAVNARFK